MSFTSQKYKKYFTLNHNGPKNVRTVQTIASIGVEMMPAGADVGCGWVYIIRWGRGAGVAFSRRAACRGEDATKSLVSFQGTALCGGVWGRMLPRAHSLISAAIKRCARLLWMTPSANRNTYSVAVFVGCVPWVEALRTLTLSCNLMSCRRIPDTSKQVMGRLSLATSYRLSQ